MSKQPTTDYQTIIHEKRLRTEQLQIYFNQTLDCTKVSCKDIDNRRMLLATRSQQQSLAKLGFKPRSETAREATYEATTQIQQLVTRNIRTTHRLPVPLLVATDNTKSDTVALAIHPAAANQFTNLLDIAQFTNDNIITIGGNNLKLRHQLLSPWLITQPGSTKNGTTTTYQPINPPPALEFVPRLRGFIFIDYRDQMKKTLITLGFQIVSGTTGLYFSSSPANAIELADFANDTLATTLKNIKTTWPFNYRHLKFEQIENEIGNIENPRPTRGSKPPKNTKSENQPIKYHPYLSLFYTLDIKVAATHKLQEITPHIRHGFAETMPELTQSAIWGFRSTDTAERLQDQLDDDAEIELFARHIENTCEPAPEIQPPQPQPPFVYDDFQITGIAHIHRSSTILISDDMGTGKTFQATGYVDTRQEATPGKPTKTLVIVQADQLDNWSRTMTAVPKNRFHIIRYQRATNASNYGKTDQIEFTTATNKAALDRNDRSIVVIVSFHAASIHEILKTTEWTTIIIDESHNIKNPGSQRTRGLIENHDEPPRLRCERMIWLTGTEITDTPVDLFPFCSTAIWRSNRTPMKLARFKKLFSPPKGQGLPVIDITTHDRHLTRLATALDRGPRLRRLKEHVYAGDLSPKKRKPWIVPVHNSEITRTGERELELFHSLSQTTSAQDKIATEHQISKLRLITAMAKLPFIAKAIARISSPDDPILVYTFHTSIADALHIHLHKHGVDSVVAHGKNTSPADRADIAFRFNSGTHNVLISTIAALNAGHTITRTRMVFFVELDHRGRIIEQCEDRAWRRGQTRDVQIRYFVIKNSYDGRIAQNIMRKDRIANIATGDDTRRILYNQANQTPATPNAI